MNNKWQNNLRNIEPYVPGEQPKNANIIKLNANENPYPPSPKVKEVINGFDTDSLRLYPDSNVSDFKKALADYYNVNEENVFVGNGSDDVLALCFQSFFCSDKPIVFPDITYSFYPVWCDLFSIPYKTLPLGNDFRICLNDYKAENGGVVLPNPNAPTSLGEGREQIETLLNYNSDSVVLIDEAYVDFGGYSSVELISSYENLIVTGTFSKSRSLAGMRIGFAIASKALIDVLEAVKNSYNSYTVDQLSIAAGIASIKDDVYFKKTLKRVIETRERVADAMTEMGFVFLNSQTNFLMASHPNHSMKDMFDYLKENNILIRYFNLPRIDVFVRITIGTDEEMDAFLSAVKSFLSL